MYTVDEGTPPRTLMFSRRFASDRDDARSSEFFCTFDFPLKMNCPEIGAAIDDIYSGSRATTM